MAPVRFLPRHFVRSSLHGMGATGNLLPRRPASLARLAMLRPLVRVLVLLAVPPCVATGAQLPAGFPPLDSETARQLAGAGLKQRAGDVQGALADYATAIDGVASPHPSALTERGLLRLNSGEPAAALADFERAAVLAPNADLPRALSASALVRMGETGKAFTAYDALVALRPPSLLGYWGRADLRASLGDYHGAISDYTAILVREPFHAKLFLNRGNARRASDELPEALTDHDHAVRLDPKDALAWTQRAETRRRLGRFQDAVTDYDEALRLKPEDISAEVRRALVKIEAGRSAEALADLNLALERTPRQPALLHGRGRAHRANGDLNAAIADYTALITGEKSQLGEWFRDRAEARQAAGDAAGAEADRAQARFAARLQFALVMGNPNRRGALPQLTQAIELDPTLAEAYLERGLIHQRFDRPELARADFTRALELRPGYPEAIAAQADGGRRPLASPAPVRTPVGGTATAADAARQLASVRKAEAPLLQRALMEKQMKGDFAGAHAGYAEAIRHRPSEASGYLRRGTMALMLENYGAAIADFDRVVELQPIAPTVSLALTLRGVARQAQGEWEAAVSDFDRSHATVPDFPAKNRFFRRHLLQRLGRPDRGPSLAAIEARVDSAWIKLLGGFLEDRVSEAELLAGIEPADATTVARRSCGAYFHIGMKHLGRGDRTQARAFLQRAIAVDLKLGLASEERLAEHVLARTELARLADAP